MNLFVCLPDVGLCNAFRGCNRNVLTVLRMLLSSDGPPPGASVLDLYYESLKKSESEKARLLSRKNTLADIVADVMTMGLSPLRMLLRACHCSPSLCDRPQSPQCCPHEAASSE
jgi:hypothetical protein